MLSSLAVILSSSAVMFSSLAAPLVQWCDAALLWLQDNFPETQKVLMRFLNIAWLYRRFCCNFPNITAPLTDLTSPKLLLYDLYSLTSPSINSRGYFTLGLFRVLWATPRFSSSTSSPKGIGSVLLYLDPSVIESYMLNFYYSTTVI